MLLPARINLEDYSPQKILAAQLMANKDINGFTNNDIARESNIDVRTLYRWACDPEFVEIVNYYAELAQDAFIPELYSSLRKAVRGGSTRAMELVLKNRGKLIDRREVQGTLGLDVQQVSSLTQDVLVNEIQELKKKVKQLEKPSRPDLPQQIIEAEFKEADEA